MISPMAMVQRRWDVAGMVGPTLASIVDCICFAAFHSSDFVCVPALMVVVCVEMVELGRIEHRFLHQDEDVDIRVPTILSSCL